MNTIEFIIVVVCGFVLGYKVCKLILQKNSVDLVVKYKNDYDKEVADIRAKYAQSVVKIMKGYVDHKAEKKKNK